MKKKNSSIFKVLTKNAPYNSATNFYLFAQNRESLTFFDILSKISAKKTENENNGSECDI